MARQETDISVQETAPVSSKHMVTIYTIVGFCIGLLFPIISILAEYQYKHIQFDFSKLEYIHGRTPVFYIVDLAPIVIALIFYFFAKRNRKQNEELEKMLAEQNEIFRKNSLIAKRIGEGDLIFDNSDIDQNDILGKSLLMMKNNLAATSQRENEQTWITKGKEKINDILRQRNNINELAYETIISLIEYIDAVQGAFYLYDDDNNILVNIATFAYNRKKYITQEFKIGSGLVGQAAFERDIIYRKEIPADYVTISSGILGDQKPQTLLLSPLISDEKLQGVIEFASLNSDMSDKTLRLIKEVSEIIAQSIFNLKVNTQTEKLLDEAQQMTLTLQKNEDELRKNAAEMERAQADLQESNRQLEAQILQVERGQKRQYALLENASEVISIYDRDAIVTYESPSSKNILGYDPDNIVGKSAIVKFDDVSRSKFHEVFKQLLANSETPVTFEYQYQKSQDELLWLEATGRNLLNNPAIQGIIFNTRDITVRKIAEKAQRMSGQMQALSENSLDAILRLSPDGKFFYVNPVAEVYTGKKKEDMLQKNIDEVELSEAIANCFKEAIERVLQNQRIFDTETTFPATEGGEDRIIQLNAIPEYNTEKELETILIVAHDITERKRIEMEIEEKNKNITESINYAQRIQSAIIPSMDAIEARLPKFFMFYRPRDVVSGDFPWFFEKDDNIFIAAVDCTGHGVPGALLSFIGYFNLNIIADHAESMNAGEVLDHLHLGVRKTLKQDSEEQEARDGMDVALCKINFATRTLDFSGAHRPLYYLNSQRELVQYKGTAQAIGGKPPRKGKEEKKFENYQITFNPGEKIFFFSDGLPDQIGGDDGRKYRPGRIKELIETHPEASMPQFRELFEKDFLEFKGANKQVDDILLIGIEF
ncbi:MAG: PAS domain S-box protein [Bacteroidales bacterium]|nr:PAS domain S-box protein [Bacteroidales bacterium]